MKVLSFFSLAVFLILLTALKMKSEVEPVKIETKEKALFSKPILAKPIIEVSKKKEVVLKKRNPKIRKKGVKQQVVSVKNMPKDTLKNNFTEQDFKEFSYVDEEENLYVEAIVVDGEDAISFGDVLVGEAESIFDKVQKGESVKIKKPIPWSEGKVPYVIKNDVVNKQRIIEAISEIESKVIGHLQFIEKSEKDTETKNYLVFSKGDQNCYSYVGMQGGPQKVSLSENCGVKEIMHELVHAIGFFHEQNRSDRDSFIEVHFYNIEEKFRPQFKKISNSWQHLFESEFDFNSIMLYPPTAFSMFEDDYAMTTIEGDPYAGNQGELSNLDIFRIKTLYPKKY